MFVIIHERAGKISVTGRKSTAAKDSRGVVIDKGRRALLQGLKSHSRPLDHCHPNDAREWLCEPAPRGKARSLHYRRGRSGVGRV